MPVKHASMPQKKVIMLERCDRDSLKKSSVENSHSRVKFHLAANKYYEKKMGYF